MKIQVFFLLRSNSPSIWYLTINARPLIIPLFFFDFLKAQSEMETRLERKAALVNLVLFDWSLICLLQQRNTR